MDSGGKNFFSLLGLVPSRTTFVQIYLLASFFVRPAILDRFDRIFIS